MIDPNEEEGPIELPPAERRKMIAIGIGLGILFLALLQWWPNFSIKLAQSWIG